MKRFLTAILCIIYMLSLSSCVSLNRYRDDDDDENSDIEEGSKRYPYESSFFDIETSVADDLSDESSGEKEDLSSDISEESSVETSETYDESSKDTGDVAGEDETKAEESSSNSLENDEDDNTTGDYPFTITYKSGTENAYTIENNVITFNTISEETVYSIEGELEGNIVIDVGEEYNFELQLVGFTLTSSSECPIVVLSAKNVDIKAKAETENFIYDNRDTVDSTDETQY